MTMTKYLKDKFCKKKYKRGMPLLYYFTVPIMTWLTITEWPWHRWPRICSVCRGQFRSFLVHYLSPGFEHE